MPGGARRGPVDLEQGVDDAGGPAALAVERLRPKPALADHPEAVHHPQRGRVVGEGVRGDAAYAELLEADPQQLGGGLRDVPASLMVRREAPPDLGLRLLALLPDLGLGP